MELQKVQFWVRCCFSCTRGGCRNVLHTIYTAAEVRSHVRNLTKESRYSGLPLRSKILADPLPPPSLPPPPAYSPPPPPPPPPAPTHPAPFNMLSASAYIQLVSDLSTNQPPTYFYLFLFCHWLGSSVPC